MLILVTGKDYKKTKSEAEKKAADFLKSRVGSVLEQHTSESIHAHDLEYRAVGNMLFGGETVYIVQDFIAVYEDDFLRIVPSLAGSKNLFIFSEDAVIKDIEKSVTSAGGEVIVLKAEEKERINPFAITDALLDRDKKNTWRLYREEIGRGEDANAVMGRFLWAIKSLLLIKKNEKETAVSLGMAPFVFSKTKKAGSKWTLPEVTNLYSELLFGLPDGGEMEYHVEKIILEKL